MPGFIFWIKFISWIWGWIQSQWIRLVLTGTPQEVNVETAQEVDKDSIICIILLKNVNLSEVDQTSFHHNNFSWSLLKYPTIPVFIGQNHKGLILVLTT